MNRPDQIKAEKDRWETKHLSKGGIHPEKTTSGLEVGVVYTPSDLENQDYLRDLGFPGEYPFTRGVYPTMYRGNLWSMRQYAGFADAEE